MKEIIITLNCTKPKEKFYRDEEDKSRISRKRLYSYLEVEKIFYRDKMDKQKTSFSYPVFILFILVHYVLNADNKRNYINRNG